MRWTPEDGLEVVYESTGGHAFLTPPRCGGDTITVTALAQSGDEQVSADARLTGAGSRATVGWRREPLPRTRAFTGFPVAALDFYDDLEVDNTKSFWEKHKDGLRRGRQGADDRALCLALAPEFGDAKVFRPYRDVRFAKDKTPYKTHQGAFVAGRARRPGGTSRCPPAACAPAPASTRRPAARLAAIRAAIADDTPRPPSWRAS